MRFPCIDDEFCLLPLCLLIVHPQHKEVNATRYTDQKELIKVIYIDNHSIRDRGRIRNRGRGTCVGFYNLDRLS